MPAFTPAFNRAFKNLTNLAGTSPEKLVALHKHLTPQERFQDIQQKFELFQGLQFSSEVVAKMTALLKAVNHTVQSDKLAASLQEIAAIHDENEKFRMLKEIFKEQETLKAFAQCWEIYLQSQSTPMEEIEKRFEEVTKNSHEGMSSLDTQSKFELTKRMVQELMNIFYALFDALLISAGHKNVFAPDNNDEQGAGFRDPKSGLVYDQSGVHPANAAR
ncbi:MAG TPA: hypothetical protein VNK03_00475 [Gammaproteobacteria bacterium]|nr:hypothetical protein [Gammaproteobacteria bacterium]